MKVCCDCKEEKPLDEFSLIWSKKPYLRSYCRKCNVIRAAKWAKANRGRATENSKLSYHRRYFVGRYKRKNITMTPHQKNDWREKFLKSPVMERLFAIELTAINTGRIEQWHGKTVQEELETLLTQQAERIAEEVAGIAGVFAEDEKGNDILLIKKSDAVNLIRKLRSEV